MLRPPPVPPRLYTIADLDMLGGVADLVAAVVAMAEAGVGWIQIRAKAASGRQLCILTETALRRLEGSSAQLWIDDRVDVAALFPVVGIHVGQQDLEPGAVRSVVGTQVWIGASTHDEMQLRVAAADPEVDVIAVGPIFPTTGKALPDPVVGLRFLRQARRWTDKPLVAIGGINAHNIGAVLEAGADAAAVLGAACRGDVRRNCERLLAAGR